MMYYGYGIFRGHKSPHKVLPHDKFNPMQSITYQIIMLLVVPVQFITGLMMWDIKRFEAPIAMLGGISMVSTSPRADLYFLYIVYADPRLHGCTR